MRVLNRKRYITATDTLKAKHDNYSGEMSVGKAFSNTAFWKMNVSVNGYKGYTQLGPLVRASVHRRTLKTSMRMGKTQYGRPCPKSEACVLQYIIFRILRLTTRLYPCNLSTQVTSPARLNAIIVRYSNETKLRKKTRCSAVYKIKATKQQPHTFLISASTKTL